MREYKPGTECNSGFFNRANLIIMLCEIISIMIVNNEPIPDVPIYGTGFDKIDVKTAKNLKSTYNKLTDDAKEWLEKYEKETAGLSPEYLSYMKNPTNEESKEFYKDKSSKEQEKLKNLIFLYHIKNTFTDIIRTSVSGLCEFSKLLFEQKGLLYYI
jgi:hypothetical protein